MKKKKNKKKPQTNSTNPYTLYINSFFSNILIFFINFALFCYLISKKKMHEYKIFINKYIYLIN